MNHNRPLSATIAAVLLALVSVLGMALPLIGGTGAGGVPPAILVSAVVLGVLGLVAAWGVWRLKKWGFWLAIVVSGLDAVGAAPGLFAAPSPQLVVSAATAIILRALIIVLLLLPVSRRTYV